MAISKKRKRILVFSLIGLVVVGLTLVAVFRKHEAPITVQTEKVARRDIIEKVVATGKIQPVTQVVISPEVAGEIVALPVKEGDRVKKGDLLVQIKPDNYLASRNSAEANYQAVIANKNLAQAQLDKAETEFKRNDELFRSKLESDSVFLDFKTSYEVAKLQFENAVHQEEQAKFELDKAADDLSKTTIDSPIDGRIVRLQSRLGERVLGTSFNMGTEIMTVADLSEMEALVDVGEVDVVLIKPGQVAQLEVDSFKDRKFAGVVSEVANSAKGLGQTTVSSSSQDATKFEVHVRIKQKEPFLPGMSVTAGIETRYRTNVLTVPIPSLTTRVPKEPKKGSEKDAAATNQMAANQPARKPGPTNAPIAQADPSSDSRGTNAVKSDRKAKEAKPIEVVFVLEGDRVKMVPVKSGISDDDYYEITDGLKEGQEVVSGGFKAISRDLEDGKKVIKGPPPSASEKKEP